MLTQNLRRFLFLGAPALLAFSPLRAGTFIWNNATANWSAGASWLGGSAPGGADAADELVFGGAVAPNLAPNPSPPAYTATNDFAGAFVLNRLTLTATDPLAGGLAGIAQVVAGNALRLAGVAPQVAANGAGAVAFNTPLELTRDLLLTGDGAGVVTFNRGIAGFADLVKNGAGAFRFGTFPPPPVPPATTSTAPSENTWMGALRIDAGTVRFNNNADSGRTALRANAVVFPASAAGAPMLTCTNELRAGTLSGAAGRIETAVTGTNTNSEDLVIAALETGSFGGTVRLAPPTGTGSSLGALVVRGPGAQTLTGTLEVDKDLEIAGSLTLAQTASLGAQTKGAVVLAGGALRLDNTTGNVANRLRDGSATSTGLDAAGGGVFQLVTNGAGTTEIVSRIQFGAQTGSTTIKTKARAGETRIGVVHQATPTALSILTFQSYERDATTEQPLGTVEFSAVNGAGATVDLAATAISPRIVFSTLPIAVSNGLLNNNTGTTGTGWGVVKSVAGLAFATHGANGIAPVATTATWSSSATANVVLAGNQAIAATAFNLHTLRLAPTAAGQTLSIAAGGTLVVKGIAHSGAFDSTISGAGALAGATPRYVHVEQAALTLEVGVGNTAPLVKGGAGTLILASTANPAGAQIFAINRGAVRCPLTALPGGELRLRGGVLEITGGGTFARPLVDATGLSAAGTVNWSTTELAGTPAAPTKTDSDRGGGGFAAIGADAIVDLGTAGPTVIAWEQKGFVQSGFALVLGSAAATAKITLVDNIDLTSGDVTINYNAREIRVDDNPASSADRAVLSGSVSGSLYNDLLKTGAGVLELSGANTLAGALLVQGGTLVVSGSAAGAIGVRVMSGAKLAGAGVVTHILLENGGAISPGDANAATLTAASLTWKAGGLARFDLGATNDRLDLGAGVLVKRGAGAFAFDFGGTGANGAVYPLIAFGTTNFAASDFSATNLPAGVAGVFKILGGTTLVFDTTTLTPIEQWRLAHFGTSANAGPAADTADPEADGLRNLDEYALGTDPLASSTAPLLTRVANRATLTFPRNAAATDVTFIVQAASDLTAVWTDLATAIGAGAWSPLTGVTVSENAGIVTLTDSADLAVTAKRFLRLKITRP